MTKEKYLSVQYLENCVQKKIPDSLREQYTVTGNDKLDGLILSPRATVRDGMYMTCTTCYRNIIADADKPPRFGLTNGWVIGQLPQHVINKDVDDILAATLAKIRIFSKVYSFSAGAHKSIKGHHVFFANNPERAGASFEYMLRSGVAPEIYIMICGRVTPLQRDIIRRRCTINAKDYKTLLNWLIDNHLSYSNIQRPQCCPQPVLVGGFDETKNNTDKDSTGDPEMEGTIEGEELTFASGEEPTQDTGPYQSQKELIFSYLKGDKPTVMFRNGDYIGQHKINLMEMFPLVFPYGWGGPDERRLTKVGKSAILRHYCQ